MCCSSADLAFCSYISKVWNISDLGIPKMMVTTMRRSHTNGSNELLPAPMKVISRFQ